MRSSPACRPAGASFSTGALRTLTLMALLKSGNRAICCNVLTDMRKSTLLLLALLAAPLLPSASSDYEAAAHKVFLIEHHRLRPGSRVELTAPELNAYARQEIADVAPAGIRNARLELGTGTATGSALVDFGKLRRAEGKPPTWIMSHLLDGERPVTVTARIRSSGGTATVDVERVEISGITVEGRLLDYLIGNYLMPAYPNAKVGQPFALGHGIERLDVQPSAVAVLIGR